MDEFMDEHTRAGPWGEVARQRKEIAALRAREQALEGCIERERARVAELAGLLSELHALVVGECPSLLNEDSGGNARLDMAIEAALAGKQP